MSDMDTEYFDLLFPPVGSGEAIEWRAKTDKRIIGVRFLWRKDDAPETIMEEVVAIKTGENKDEKA